MNTYTKISSGGAILGIIGMLYSYVMIESYRGMSFVLSKIEFWSNMFFISLFVCVVCVIAAIYFYKKGK